MTVDPTQTIDEYDYANNVLTMACPAPRADADWLTKSPFAPIYDGGPRCRRAAKLERTMKTGVHPEYVDAHVRCTCGNEFMTRSTKPEIHVEICSACHPFYTGRQKLVDTGGRVERFQRRVAKGRRAARGTTAAS